MGVARAGTLVSSVSYYKSEWGEDHPYARHDPAEANRLLDEMGLTDRDRDGFRTLPNGETINLTAVQVGKELSSEGHELGACRIGCMEQSTGCYGGLRSK